MTRCSLSDEKLDEGLSRAPVCLDATPAGVGALVAVLRATNGGGAEQVAQRSETQRREVVTLALRLLRLNVERLAAKDGVLPDECSSELHR